MYKIAGRRCSETPIVGVSSLVAKVSHVLVAFAARTSEAVAASLI